MVRRLARAGTRLRGGVLHHAGACGRGRGRGSAGRPAPQHARSRRSRKAEATVGAVASCALFCDEWAQASHGGELTGAIEAGLIDRDRVGELGAVLAGDTRRPGTEAVTLFDSTGLAIQDLAIAAAALEAWREGRVSAQTVRL